MAGGALLIITKAMHGGCLGLIMEIDLLRRAARDHSNGGTGLYGLRRHGGAGMGIHDEGKWQLKEMLGMEKGGGGFWQEGFF